MNEKQLCKRKSLYTRRQFYIKKEFQFQFIIKFCAILLSGIILSTTLLMICSQDTLTSSFQNSELVIQNTWYAILPEVIYTNLIVLALITIATIIITLFVSHKIAGPIFSIEKKIRLIKEGDLSGSIELRKNDQVSEIAHLINEMTGNLNKKITGIRRRVDNIQTLLPANKTPEEIVEQLKELDQYVYKSFQL